MIMGSDGWELHGAYHWLVNQAAQGRIAVIMPDITDNDGIVQIYSRPYDTSMRSMLSRSQQMRGIGHVAFAKVGHMVAEGAR